VSSKAAIRAEAERLQAVFLASGASVAEVDLLQPAATLLELYGEDIRARAYTTCDPDQGEMMLRPDFTVPVVQQHLAGGSAPARYTYLGEVFRKQPAGSGRAREYLQVGYELFNSTVPAAADAEVFALFSEILLPLGLTPVTGDIGILLAAVDSLSTSEARKSALRRHIWRPRRFHALLDRFTGTLAPSPHRAALPGAAGDRFAPLIAAAGPAIGVRTPGEIEARLARLQEEAKTPPIAAAESDVLDEILSLRKTLPNAFDHLRVITGDLPGLDGAVCCMARRIEALDAAGVNVTDLPFEASYGRTMMEYYDGFVFGFIDENWPDLPPVAAGGRYDALCRVLGSGQDARAVGGAIRPERVHQMQSRLAGSG